jgi:hypothetical protein
MTASTATAVLATIPAAGRVKRSEVGGAEKQLRNLEQQTKDFDIKQLAYGVLYADATGRTSGTISMAVRRATPWQAAQLIASMARDGLTLVAEVPAWMNRNALPLLAKTA